MSTLMDEEIKRWTARPVGRARTDVRRKNSWDQARESTARDTADIRTEKPDTHAVSGVIHGEAARHAGPTGASPEKKAQGGAGAGTKASGARASAGVRKNG